MKAAISILLVIGVIFGAYKLWEYWDSLERQKELDTRRAQQETASGDQLPGLPQALENELREVKARNTKAFRAFLDKIKRSPLVQDPRLAWIELDYVVMVSREDPIEAKRVFKEVKARVTPDSPVYKRIKELEKNYE